MKEEKPKLSPEEERITHELARLIEKDAHTRLLTVAELALTDLASGQIDSALLRLRIDRDKLLNTNRELYEYLNMLLEQRNLPR